MHQKNQIQQMNCCIPQKKLANATKLHIATIRKMFMDEPGVIRLGHAALGRRRQYFTLRIPARVAARVFSRMTVGPDAKIIEHGYWLRRGWRDGAPPAQE